MNRQTLLGVLLLVISLFLISCNAEATILEDDIKMVPIQIEMMKKDIVEHTYTAIGEVVPKNQINLIIGKGSVEGIFVMPGDIVNKGTTLVVLDDDTVLSSYTSTESQLRTIRENLRSQYTVANKNYINQKTLYESGIASKETLNQAKTQADSLLRQLNDASVNYTNKLNNLKESISDRLLVSPIEGKVAAVYINEGQVVNNQLAISIIDESQLFVKTFISGDLKKKLTINDTVKLKLDGNRNSILEGTVYQINELPDMTTKLFEMLIEVQDSKELDIGEYTEIELVIDRYEALMIPTEAIIRTGVEKYVYFYENEKVFKQLIDTGLSKGVWIEIKDVDELRHVVIRGQNQLTAGSQILIVELE